MIRRTLAYLLLTGSLAVLCGCNGFNGFRLFHRHWGSPCPNGGTVVGLPECSPCCDVPVEGPALMPVPAAPLAPVAPAPAVTPPPPSPPVIPVVPATPAVPVPATPSKLVTPHPQH